MKRSLCVLIGAAVVALTTSAVAGAAVPCPVPTDDPARYEGANAPFRCHFAVTDSNGLVVILREGRAATDGPGPFGRRHAAIDRGVDDEAIGRVVSTVQPVDGQQRRLHYVEEVREGEQAVEVWVVVDRAPSRQAPDTRPFGVITAFCRTSGGSPERCPSWAGGQPADLGAMQKPPSASQVRALPRWRGLRQPFVPAPPHRRLGTGIGVPALTDDHAARRCRAIRMASFGRSRAGVSDP